MKIVATGASGLIGSRFVELLQSEFNLFTINSSSGINILERKSLFQELARFSPDVIVHFAAKADVDGCEKDKENDLKKLKQLNLVENNSVFFDKISPEQWERDATAFAVNVVGTKNVTDFARNNNVKVVYISTDFVFDGQKEYYTEEDQTNAVNWYGQTKLWGEHLVESISSYLIARTAYPYGFSPSGKKGFLRKIYEYLNAGKEVFLVTDQNITLTFIDDIVLAIKFLLEKQATGIFHVVGDTFITPFEIGRRLAELFQLDLSLIHPIARDDFFKNRAQRLFQLRLKNDKLKRFGYYPKSLDEGFEAIQKSSSFFS